MNYLPFTIASRFRIRPPASPPSIDGRIDLVMQHGAFGSGEHETTENCLELMETLPEIGGARVLDLGSGTGILAIAALKLGATAAVCIDIEEQAVQTARLNARHNAVEDRIEHVHGTLDAVTETGFDLVFANIYGDILVDLAVPLAAKARPGGMLLLSGMLWEYNFDVRQAYQRQGCRLVANRLLEEFSSLVLEKL